MSNITGDDKLTLGKNQLDTPYKCGDSLYISIGKKRYFWGVQPYEDGGMRKYEPSLTGRFLKYYV